MHSGATNRWTWDDVCGVAAEFADVPFEAVIKEDALRLGLWFTERALASAVEYARKSYFIFSFDRTPLSQQADKVRFAAPEEIRFAKGPSDLAPTVLSVRLNPESPWLVDLDVERDTCVLRFCDRCVADVDFAPTPPYYGATTSDGVPLVETAPSIEWGYLLYLTVFRMCQYFGKEEECRFCDINRNFRQQREHERIYNAVKPVERIAEAMRIVADSDSPARAYTLTGGSITSDLLGHGEADYYIRFAEAIERDHPGRWIAKMVVQALPADDVRRIRDAGIRIYHPNYEVWDPELFARLCPGKARYVGRDAWIERILAAAELFEPYCVIPNFVAGIEMAEPAGFRTEEEAWESTGTGIDFFMSNGVMPRFTTWCPEPLSVLGAEASGPASLRYHVGLARLWRDTHKRHGLPAPIGYGEPGLGRAVFSVSSFMDVIDVAPAAAGGGTR